MCFCAHRSGPPAGVLCVFGVVWLWLVAAVASAHPSALSRVDVYFDQATREAEGPRVELDLDGTSSVDLLARALGRAERPELSQLATYQARLVDYVTQHFTLKTNGAACSLARADNQRFSTAKNRLYLRLHYRCAGVPKRVVLESRLFADEPTPHQVMGGVHLAGRYQRSLLEPHDVVAFDVAALPLSEPTPHGFRMATPPGPARVSIKPSTATTASGATPEPTPDKAVAATGLSFTAFLGEGWRHILGGYDHLLFVFALVLGAAGLRELAKWITTFTIAHSVSLALSALELVKVSPRIVEPLIALSIVWVGVETLRGVRQHRRIGVVFAFGLLHGLGFGGALFELGLNRSDIVTPLLGFNFGVELGQLALVTPAFALLAWQRKHHAAWSAPLRSWAAAGLSLVAAIWFVERLAA